MSTASSQFARRQSPADGALQDPNAPDPYLSAPSDPDELSFQASAIRLTPVSGSPARSGRQGSSPHDGHDPSPQSDLLSHQANDHTDLSTCTSPSNPSAFLEPFNMDLGSGSGSWETEKPSALGAHERDAARGSNYAWSSSMTMDPSQLLSPQPLNKPSPTSDMATLTAQGNPSGGMQDSIPRSHGTGLGISQVSQYLSAQVTAAKDDGSSNGPDPDSVRGRSPIVKIEEVSRGDSPKGIASAHQRRISQSSMHLSPQDAKDMSSESEDEDTDEPRSVSSLSVARSVDGTWLPNPTTGQGGLDPRSRGDELVPSPNELKGQREREEKNADISIWTATVSAAASEAGDEPPARSRRRNQTSARLRARSTGDRPLQQQDYFNLQFCSGDRSIPGPGILVHEDSDDDLSEHDSDIGTDSDSLPVNVNEVAYDQTTAEGYDSLGLTNSDDMVRRHPWQDPLWDSTPRTEAMQPYSSNAAMIAFEKRARDLETASLAATIDANSVFNMRVSLENISLSNRAKKTERRPSLLKRQFLRTSSMLKRQASEMSLGQSSSIAGASPDGPEPQRKDSHSPRHRLSLTKHLRSPSLNNAVIAMSGQMAAVGGSHSVRAASPNTEASTVTAPLKGRGRSRSEIPRPAAPGLMELMTSHGGPPVASIAHSAEPTSDAGVTLGSTMMPKPDRGDGDEEEEMDTAEDKGLVMDFPAVSRLPVPTFEGFKAQIMQLNPRLEPALVHRFANEQLRRYKKLVELQQKHANAVATRSCKAGHYCFALGGAASLQSRQTPAESDAGHTQFRVTDFSQSRDQPYAVGEGAITAAQFPPGVSLPPVASLPAEFECPVCFEVRKFQKPSDWSKHVHEDVHPFTCTFPNCNEPKSFKRKADWVRHESERHRQLEWWSCSFAECNHKCFRKDNFVQHLAREHKMPEPKATKSKAMAAPDAQSESQRERELEQLWHMVESCRHENRQTPRQEPCRFCGNICGTWKKLTVHLAKHMEQLAMPVLELAKQSTAASGTQTISAQVETTGSTAAAFPTPLVASYQPSVQAASGTSSHLAQQQYQTSHSTNTPANPALAAFDIPVLSYPSISGEQLSMEPDRITDVALNSNDQFTGYGIDQYEPHAQPAHPLHQNSVTYPPPYNAVPRQRTPEPNPATLQPSFASMGPEFASQAAYSAGGPYPTSTYQNPMTPNPPYTSAPYSSGYPST